VFADLFTQADGGFQIFTGFQLGLQRLELSQLVGHQEVDTVQSNAAIVTDDTTTAVGIRQTGDNTRLTAVQDVLGIDIENALVVGLAIVGEDLLELRVQLATIHFTRTSTILIPPNGMMARFSGLSVCRPTIFSRLCSI